MNDKNNENHEFNQYNYNLLLDETVEDDLFEDRTHDKIADSLYQLINNEEKGISIGLEGQWGSGKSSIISILKKKFINVKDTFIFQFDAWSHEGDPLRRIFLEFLIDELNTVDLPSHIKSKLIDLKNIISNRTKIKKIITKQSVTCLGTLITISLFFVPIGSGMFRLVDSSIISPTGDIYGLFLFCILACSSPLLVIFLYFIYLLYKVLYKEKEKFRNIFKIDRWAFLEKKIKDTSIQEVSEEDERSSIEFEDLFKKIITLAFNDCKLNKLILVIDNLDRIDPAESLKIWSTLQTFIQLRNIPEDKSSWFSKIWIIVPYDPDGLSVLWDKRLSVNDIEDVRVTKNNREISKSFFDKCFQLRIEVPKPVFTGWENYARDMINNALISWEKTDKEELIRILRITRKSIDDIPTPREIKNYINQVGFLRYHCNREIPVGSIAYYVCWRELYNKTVKDIRSELVTKNLIGPNHSDQLPPTIFKDLAGLVFGVSPKKGQQLLLEPEISESLKIGNHENLKNLCDMHGEGFWSIFYYHIEQNDITLDYALSSAKAIVNSIYKNNELRCKEFIDKIYKIQIQNNNEEVIWTEDDIIDKYNCLLQIGHLNETFIKRVYNHLINALNNVLAIPKTNINYADILKRYQSMLDIIMGNGFNPEQIILPKLNLEKLIQWANISFNNDYTTYNYLIPSSNVIEEIINDIVAGQPIKKGILESVNYLLKGRISGNWSNLVNRCREYIIFHQGSLQNHSPEVYKIIFMLFFNIDATHEKVQQLLLLGEFYNLFFQLKDHVIIEVAILCGSIFKNNIQSQAITQIGNSDAGYKHIINFWKILNEDNANNIIQALKQIDSWSFIWDLAKNHDYKLVGLIITKCLDDEETKKLFIVQNGLEKLKCYANIIDDDKKEERVITLANFFIKNTELENEIINFEDIIINDFSYELIIIARQTTNIALINKITDKIKLVDKATWLNDFQKSHLITELCFEIKIKSNDISVGQNFTDAFIDFSNKINSGESIIDEWHFKNWESIILLMNNSLQNYYNEKITEFIKLHISDFNEVYYKINESHFKYPDVLKMTKEICRCIDDSCVSKDIKRLKLINMIMNHDEKKIFNPDADIVEVIKNRFIDLYTSTDDESIKILIRSISKRFNIDIDRIVKEAAKIEETNTPVDKNVN